MSKFSRRDFITSSALGFGALSLAGCNDDDNEQAAINVAFLHGVASGDPQSDRLIIWTRVTPELSNASLNVEWQISSTVDFKTILQKNTVSTSATADFTVKVDVSKLSPATTYYYRFICNGVTSAIGHGKTLAIGTIDKVKLAVCSCSNYPAGYFHVYAEMAKQNELDAFLHLGDYIYEYGAGGYAYDDAAKLGRELKTDNNKEIIKLDDYRRRYALYRTDKDLQMLHQNVALIAVWDDHELSNDTWKNGAENHDDKTEGDFNARKLAALQAYFEWMPIRPATTGSPTLNIYRQFKFGNLVNLMMLDTRIIARDKQLSYASYFTSNGFDAATFTQDIMSSSRTLLGAEQLQWLQQTLATSSQTWNVLGQQILMAKMLIPAELLSLLESRDLTKAQQTITELMTIKGRIAANDPSVTATERARVETVLPYNLDAWDGYAYEREVIYGTALNLKKKLIVLAGDTHNGWYSQLSNKDQLSVGIELATSSVSSPGMDEYLSLGTDNAKSAQFEQVFSTLIDELQYTNLNQRGYLLVEFSPTQVKADWIYVNTIKSKDYQVDSSRQHHLTFDTSLKALESVQVATTA